MNRFHVHLHVADLADSVRFYSRLFGAEPTRRESDYAKWMLEDPRLNFAISTRGEAGRIDHLGFQVDGAEELPALETRAREAEAPVLDEGTTSCCYARSRKHWVTDPQGVAWERFHTLHDIPVFGRTAADPAPATAAVPAAPARTAAGLAAIPVVASVRSACC